MYLFFWGIHFSANGFYDTSEYNIQFSTDERKQLYGGLLLNPLSFLVITAIRKSHQFLLP